jgi:ribosomal protein S18 acetylase RimI-like enzyme
MSVWFVNVPTKHWNPKGRRAVSVEEEIPLIDGFTIGPARANEMGAICEIAKVAWEPIHDSMIDDVGVDIHDAVSGDWRARKAGQILRQYDVNPSWVLAVRDGNEVAAFVTFGIDAERSMGTILNNAVGATYQGRGIGTAMYEHVLNLFRDAGLQYASVTTGLDRGHAPARKAYVNAGFDLSREDVTYYQKLDKS